MRRGLRLLSVLLITLLGPALLAEPSTPGDDAAPKTTERGVDNAAKAQAVLDAAKRHKAPRTWEDEALSDWALPIAALGVRPGHFTVEEYYAAPIDNLRTYPIYHPDREPEGYWDWLHTLKPEPLVEEVGKARTEEEWIELGRRVFVELDVKGFRRDDPEVIAEIRSRKALEGHEIKVTPEGWIHGLRWVPTEKGVQLGVSDCAGCHTHFMDDGTVLHGAPFDDPIDDIVARHIGDGMDYFFPGDSLATQLHRLYAVPWVENDPNARIADMTPEQLYQLRRSNPAGTFARANGSPFHPNKVPDLIGIRDRHWIDATATHRHRGPGDLMRYAAMVAYEEKMEFGEHQFYTDEQRFIRYRLPDDMLYALALYIYSIEPPANPNRFDARAAAGRRIFEREGCVHCHTPPLYTSNELTPVEGFQPPKDHYDRYAITPRSVGTDPGLGLYTRKGTGYYRIPSLRNIWYRKNLLHSGFVNSLEELFDPARLEDDFEPSGFKGLGVERRAIEGHEFGLELDAIEREQLIAFLLTL
ncbi:MAG: hypothetical protein AAGC60_03090 [Acidobacteriota bacterium]